MNNKKIFWGVFFISFGALVLINNFNPYALDYDWHIVWKMWPLLLVLIGLNYILKQTGIKWTVSALSALLAGFLLFSSVKSTHCFIKHDIVDVVADDSDDEDGDEENDWNSGDSLKSSANNPVNIYTQDMNPGIRKAKLKFDLAAGSVKMRPPVSDLVRIEARGSVVNYTFSPEIKGDYASIFFKNQKKHIVLKKGMHTNSLDCALNAEPVWNIDFESGASSVDLDLSPYKTEKIYFHSGASSVDLKLGDRLKYCKLDLESGASSVDIYVPRNSGVKIKTDNSLSSKDFRDFIKQKNGVYQTENYNKSVNKIDIFMEAGVSSVSVSRY